MSTGTMSPFGQKASNKEGGDFELPPSGLHPAVLVALIDLGTQSFTYNGETKESRKIFIVWELTGQADSKGENFLVAADYTWSLHKKANFRIMLEGWSGRSFADDEEFDPLILVGKPCVVNVCEGQSGNGKKFAEIMAVANPMKGQSIPPATHEPFAWHLSQAQMNEDPPIPDWIPRIYGRLVKDDIKKCGEWALFTQQPGHGTPPPRNGDSSKPVANPSKVAPVDTAKPPF